MWWVADKGTGIGFHKGPSLSEPQSPRLWRESDEVPSSCPHLAPGQKAMEKPYIYTLALFLYFSPFSSQLVELESLIKQIHLQNLTIPLSPRL